jgi:hypothetical protein
MLDHDIPSECSTNDFWTKSFVVYVPAATQLVMLG